MSRLDILNYMAYIFLFSLSIVCILKSLCLGDELTELSEE